MIDNNTAVEYTCDPGYTHTAGDLIRTCLDDGSLTGSPPLCTSKLHGELFALFNKYILFFTNIVYIRKLSIQSVIGYNTDVEYTCHPGYTHTAGDLIRTCLDGG